MHIIAVYSSSFGEEKEKREEIRKSLTREKRNVIIQYFNKNHKDHPKKVEDYKKKHPKAKEKIFA